MTKINGQLGGIGKASVNYNGGSENLKIQVNAGNTIDLQAGPGDFDALKRLGIASGVLTAPAKDGKADTSATTGITPTYGLGFSGTLDISTKTGANLARSQLLGVLSSLQSTYQTTNKPPATNTSVGNTSGKATSYQTSQVANYNLALSLLMSDRPSDASAALAGAADDPVAPRRARQNLALALVAVGDRDKAVKILMKELPPAEASALASEFASFARWLATSPDARAPRQ